MEEAMPLDLSLVRSQFPALRRQAELPAPAIFFDNPGGTQIAQAALDRMTSYLIQHNANHGGVFGTSRESDAVLEEAHAAMADFLNAASPAEIIFGNNMTTLTLHISRSLALSWHPGDTIVVTRLDHDANITPWVLAAEDRGVDVRRVDFDVEDGTLRLDDLAAALEARPRRTGGDRLQLWPAKDAAGSHQRGLPHGGDRPARPQDQRQVRAGTVPVFGRRGPDAG
jgi:selenocysteine lyase/cysteine desulfurase